MAVFYLQLIFLIRKLAVPTKLSAGPDRILNHYISNYVKDVLVVCIGKTSMLLIINFNSPVVCLTG